MKKLVFIFFILIFIFSACAPAEIEVEITQTPTISPSATYTSTPNITPLPTIPTFTPTFDVSRIVTVTPAESAECPKEDFSIEPDFPYCDKIGCLGGPYHEATLNYLNSGGSIKKLEDKHWGKILDLTGDDVREIVYADSAMIFVYGCKNGKFEVLLQIEGTQNAPILDNITDLNKNGLPELIILNAERRAFRSIRIFEWKGSEFVSLIKNVFYNEDKYLSYDWLGGTVFDYKLIDINDDGLEELSANDKSFLIPDYLPSAPLREITISIGWNGENFVIVSIIPSHPIYTFQAIQDADKLSQNREFIQAFNLYQTIISENKLDWWSKEKQQYESYTNLNLYFEQEYRIRNISLTATPTAFPITPTPKFDNTEYPQLASYAYYRIMLLQIVQGQAEEANITYQTLQDTFGNDIYAKSYIEMATAFLEAYQVNQKMYDGCAAVIQYAVEHPEILIPLGSDYHGWQSKIYKPEDVCPFR